jgi:hypothetical protein
VGLALGIVNTSKVAFQTFEIDGNVQNMLWCGVDDETVLV